MGKWEMGNGANEGNAKRKKKACAERENFMKSILNWIVQSTFSSHRRAQCPVCDKGDGVRGCGKFFERLPNKAPKHMAREHYYGRQRGVNAANGHNDKRNGHLDTQTQGAARRGVCGGRVEASPALNYWFDLLAAGKGAVGFVAAGWRFL